MIVSCLLILIAWTEGSGRSYIVHLLTNRRERIAEGLSNDGCFHWPLWASAFPHTDFSAAQDYRLIMPPTVSKGVRLTLPFLDTPLRPCFGASDSGCCCPSCFISNLPRFPDNLLVTIRRWTYIYFLSYPPTGNDYTSSSRSLKSSPGEAKVPLVWSDR